MKGISPLIATVLLIAFTIAVGGIVSIWISGYSQTQTTQVGSSSQDQIKCAGHVLNIINASYNTGNFLLQATAGFDLGEQTLYNPKIDGSCGSTSVRNTSTGIPSISPGQVFTINVNMSACGAAKADFARVSAVCIGPASNVNFTVLAECKKGQGCGL